MKIVNSEKLFNSLENALVEKITQDVLNILLEKEVDKEVVFDLLGDAIFQICAIIDGTELLEIEGTYYRSFITFSKDCEKVESLIASTSGSSMHECVYGIVEKVLDE